MVESATTPRRGLAGGWLVVAAGSCIGLSIMGDSLMYSVLPLAAPGLGIPLPLVGVLLSVNRLVRLLSNAWASRIFERMGPRVPFLGSLVIGAVATLLYGATGFAVFFAARLLWGIAWSGLRQGGYQAVWTGDAHQKGRLTGLLWGLVRLGSAIGVLVGGLLYDRFGYQAALWFVMATAALAVPVALMFQWAPTEPHPVVASAKRAEAAGWRGALTTPLQRWLIVAGFFEYLLSGVVVSTTAVFVAERLGADTGIAWLGIGVATLTGMLHGVRWITDLALGPAVGALSDRIGQATTAGGVTVILCGAIVGALTLPPGLAILCLFGVLLADGALHIVMSAAASGVALSTTRPHVFVGVFTTTTDAGSALGPLVAYSLVTVTGLTVVYGVLAALLLAAVLQYWRYGRALAA